MVAWKPSKLQARVQAPYLVPMTGEKLLVHLADVAKNRYHLTVWQWLPGHVGGHAANSLHNKTFPHSEKGRAFDAFGSWINMYRFARHIRRSHPNVTEGIWNSGTKLGYLSRKNGQHVKPSFWGSATWKAHKGHVHVGV